MSKRRFNQVVHLFPLGFLFLVLIFSVFYSSRPAVTRADAAPGGLSGYAWSSNIGWIDLGTPENPRVVINDLGVLSGYAWSSNIGWIKFDGGLTGPSAPNHGAQVESSGAVTGWARACSVFVNGCSGTLRPAAENGGWDGWIKMSGSWSNGVRKIGSALSGFAWGSEVLGWIDFSGVAVGDEGGGVTCYAVTAAGDRIGPPAFVSEGSETRWRAEVTSSGGPFHYLWSGDGLNAGNTADAPVVPINDPLNYNVGNYSAHVIVTDNAGSIVGEKTCSLQVVDTSSRTLTVEINGAGSGQVTGYVDGGETLTTCNTSSCSYTFSQASPPHIFLFAEPDSGSFTADWGGICNFQLDETAPCDFFLFNSQTASVTFGLTDPEDPPGGGGATTINLLTNPPVIRISQQSDGIPTSSVPNAVYQISSDSGDPAPICVKSVTSKLNAGYQLGLDISRCYLFTGNSANPTAPSECSGTNQAMIDLSADSQLNFVITIEDLDWQTLINSPYEVIVGVCGDDTTVEANNSALEFRYQPPNVEPE